MLCTHVVRDVEIFGCLQAIYGIVCKVFQSIRIQEIYLHYSKFKYSLSWLKMIDANNI
jgi:hypothetical protein